MKLMRLALTGSLLLVLAACGNNSPVKPPTNPDNPPTNPGGGLPGGIPGLPGGGLPTTPAGSGISGTVTAPSGTTLGNAVVIACAQSDTNCGSAQTTTVDSSGAYNFTDLQVTPYNVVGFQDVDGSQSLTTGDYLGGYSTDGANLTPVTPPQTGINITMTVYNDGSSSPTTPTEPGTGGSISGTLLPPGTASGVSGAFACYLTTDKNNPCDDTLSDGVELAAGASLTYSIDDLTAGQYLVIGIADTDGNGSFDDAADYIGFYPSFDAPEAVSPPAINIDIPMVPYSSVSGASIQRTTKPARLLAEAKASFKSYLLKKQLEQALKTLR